eukprot:TRINITY_DN1297_c0_g1_i1.p6 TRINITY_DN1297_c0_g1~~TRINITY_DN1297_c0_g1_i1.p6  ORF type:complete len:142 (-),score=13.76 TRINITY_DN1297_c0_g1_i1:1848-2273(-)
MQHPRQLLPLTPLHLAHHLQRRIQHAPQDLQPPVHSHLLAAHFRGDLRLAGAHCLFDARFHGAHATGQAALVFSHALSGHEVEPARGERGATDLEGVGREGGDSAGICGAICSRRSWYLCRRFPTGVRGGQQGPSLTCREI